MIDKQFLRRLAAPVGFLLLSLVLAHFIAVDPGMLDVGGGRLGAGAWPRAMLFGVTVCAGLWCAYELTPLLGRVLLGRTQVPAAADDGDYDHRRAWTGIALVVVYGLSIPFAGFMFSTVVFLSVWMWLGGMRGRIAVPAIALIGTVVLLYVFALLARMPLDRGAGVVDDATVAIYRLLKIF